MKKIAFLLTACAAVTLAAPPEVTYSRDVAPIIQEKCQTCHRPGEIAPMSFMNYTEIRPWAKGIKTAVATRKMPPWFADPAHGKFANDWTLSKAQIDTIVAWADSGAVEGDKKDLPAPKEWLEGWNIAKPDYVIEMPDAFPIPASGKVDYQYLVLPTNLTEDKWVQMVEVRPTFRQSVHHVVAFIREKGSNWLADAKPGVPYVPPTNQQFQNTLGANNEVLTVYTPGMVPDVWKPGLAKFLPAGADIVFQLHYTPNAKAGAGMDKTKVGMVFAKEAPKERVLTLAVIDFSLKIPAGAANHESNARAPHANAGTLLSFFPHMHLRGKAFEYRLVYPTGEKKTLLKVDNYDFNWQLAYKLDQPVQVPAGSKIEGTAWYDNSANNPANPDPAQIIKWGEQSWEEMMVGFYDIAVDSKFNRRTFMRPPQPPPATTGSGTGN